jgi:SAM-dependent methyltransferase
MLPYTGNVLRRIRAEGPVTALRYAAYRMTNQYLLWRWGIRAALRMADVYLESEQLGHKSRSYGGHIGTNEMQFAAFRSAMCRLLRPCRSDVFLDIGSGSGKALIMAATFPFDRIIGIEYSSQLTDLAGRAVELARPKLRCQHIELITGDATEFAIPADVSVLYFFNPFWDEVLAKVFDNLRRSLIETPRELKILFLRPENVDKIAARRTWLVKGGEVSYPASYPGDPFAYYRCDLGRLSLEA